MDAASNAAKTRNRPMRTNSKSGSEPAGDPTLVIVVDHRCARFFEVTRRMRDERRMVGLREGPALLNPEAAVKDRDLFTSTQTGTRHGKISRGSHLRSFDDHREQHRVEEAARFARLVAARAEALLEPPVGEVVLCAAPRMMGHLRGAFADRPARWTVREVPSHLTQRTPHQIADRLGRIGAIPTSDPRPPVRR